MRVATAEGPDGLFLYYMAFSIHTVKQYFESVAKKNQPIYNQMFTDKRKTNYCLKVLFLHSDESENSI